MVTNVDVQDLDDDTEDVAEVEPEVKELAMLMVWRKMEIDGRENLIARAMPGAKYWLIKDLARSDWTMVGSKQAVKIIRRVELDEADPWKLHEVTEMISWWEEDLDADRRLEIYKDARPNLSSRTHQSRSTKTWSWLPDTDRSALCLLILQAKNARDDAFLSVVWDSMTNYQRRLVFLAMQRFHRPDESESKGYITMVSRRSWSDQGGAVRWQFRDDVDGWIPLARQLLDERVRNVDTWIPSSAAVVGGQDQHADYPDSLHGGECHSPSIWLSAFSISMFPGPAASRTCAASRRASSSRPVRFAAIARFKAIGTDCGLRRRTMLSIVYASSCRPWPIWAEASSA